MKTLLYLSIFIPTVVFGQEIVPHNLNKTWEACGYYETILKRDTLTFFSYPCDSLNSDIYEWTFESTDIINFNAGSGTTDHGVLWSQYFKPGRWSLDKRDLTIIDDQGTIYLYEVYKLTDSELIVINKNK